MTGDPRPTPPMPPDEPQMFWRVPRHLLPPPVPVDKSVRRDIAKAALSGLLAAGGDHANPDIPAKRAVRYADALLQALNSSHEEARHATGNR